jgi:hypothetical protein
LSRLLSSRRPGAAATFPDLAFALATEFPQPIIVPAAPRSIR